MKQLSLALALLLATLCLSATDASVKQQANLAGDVAIEKTTVEGAQPIESDRRQLSWLLGFFTTRKYFILITSVSSTCSLLFSQLSHQRQLRLPTLSLSH